MDSIKNYLNSLETKVSQLSGIPVDAIRKNQWSDLQSESADIENSRKLIDSIVVSKPAVASPEKENPLIQKTFDLVKQYLGEDGGAHVLPDLGFGYDDLSPFLEKNCLDVHHTKHHQGYINNLNKAWTTFKDAKANNDISSINKLATGVLFNGGSHLNHSIYWTNLKPNNSGSLPTPSGDLLAKINQDFGSFDEFKSKFSSTTAGIKGSGWGWLAYDKANDKLGVYTTFNQDTVEIVHQAVPLLTCDVWEHAYYLQFKNLRAKFIENYFQVVNWDNVGERFAKAKEC